MTTSFSTCNMERSYSVLSFWNLGKLERGFLWSVGARFKQVFSSRDSGNENLEVIGLLVCVGELEAAGLYTSFLHVARQQTTVNIVHGGYSHGEMLYPRFVRHRLLVVDRKRLQCSWETRLEMGKRSVIAIQSFFSFFLPLLYFPFFNVSISF